MESSTYDSTVAVQADVHKEVNGSDSPLIAKCLPKEQFSRVRKVRKPCLRDMEDESTAIQPLVNEPPTKVCRKGYKTMMHRLRSGTCCQTASAQSSMSTHSATVSDKVCGCVLLQL